MRQKWVEAQSDETTEIGVYSLTTIFGVIMTFALYGVGAKSATVAHAAEHVPNAALQATMAAGTPTPAVTVPKVNPAPA